MVKVHTRSEEQVMTKRALSSWIASVIAVASLGRVNLGVSERVLRRWS